MTPDNNIWQQLLQLKSLTETTGIIHEAQKLQLQYWGPMILPHAKDIEIGIQVPWVENEGAPNEVHHNVRSVEFRVVETTGRAPKNLDKRLRALSDWTKRLLGDRFMVRVSLKGKVIFESKGKPPKKKANV